MFRKGDLILVRDKSNQEWVSTFTTYREKERCYPYYCGDRFWAECIPYGGNELLLLICDSPIERKDHDDEIFSIRIKPEYVISYINSLSAEVGPGIISSTDQGLAFAIIG